MFLSNWLGVRLGLQRNGIVGAMNLLKLDTWRELLVFIILLP
jgi:hypothetical protein